MSRQPKSRLQKPASGHRADQWQAWRFNCRYSAVKVRRQSHRTIHFLHIAVIIDRAALSKEKSSSQARIDVQPAKTGGFQGRVVNRVDLRRFRIRNPSAFAQGIKDGQNKPDSRFRLWFLFLDNCFDAAQSQRWKRFCADSPSFYATSRITVTRHWPRLLPPCGRIWTGFPTCRLRR